jgi:hypothetical protein
MQGEDRSLPSVELAARDPIPEDATGREHGFGPLYCEG